ncbi:zinc-dependent metalloprotease [Microbacterium sp. LRZ72]|uniref:zinc-dependent metalloprotease n=1 Tax=Microbacterium sp. LRZ72 TaxID=2942481 RepID=UPI0029AD1AA7|nr:zinc-dependent metalloprotease [Microbacterium sp. LRZ72]MDX2375735.1 zinc-dependent metalloprotease [Microbacterium sp. LRZ72]
MERDDADPEDLQELLRRLLGGGEIDPAEIERVTGMKIDPAMMAQAMQQMRGMFESGGDGIPWELAAKQAAQIAQSGGHSVTDGQRTDLDHALALADLWLGEATTISELGQEPRVITRAQWVEATMPVWQELAEPVATSIADALTRTLEQQAPEELASMMQGAGRLMRQVGGSLFATQLGHVVGRLSTEVVSGGDVGLPLMPPGEATIVPQNFADMGAGLEIDDDQLAIATSVRELAHARLFRHAKWLRLHMISQVTEFARGIDIDTDALEDLASRFDPSRPEELREALENGALLPSHSPAQRAALERLENLLATVEGWVDVVTQDATARLPKAAAIAETVRRRRAAGGPAEQALGSLVGLELRPRRLREAAAMWRAVTDAVGVEARDALWDYPDFMPGAEDIDDPGALIERLRARSSGAVPSESDDVDDAIARILAGEEPPASGPDSDRAQGTGDDGTSPGTPPEDPDDPTAR